VSSCIAKSGFAFDELDACEGKRFAAGESSPSAHPRWSCFTVSGNLRPGVRFEFVCEFDVAGCDGGHVVLFATGQELSTLASAILGLNTTFVGRGTIAAQWHLSREKIITFMAEHQP